MAKEKIKISKNEVDKNPPLYVNYGDPRAATIDPNELSYADAVKRRQFLFSQMPGTTEPEEPEEPEDPSISKYIPQLSDIFIESEEFDYTTTPVTVRLKLKIFDRTDAVIKGIRVQVPPQ